MNWLEQLALTVKHCGFRYIRFHGLFHDDMCVYREEKGQPIYNWQYIDELFDRLLDIGIRPFVELSFFPKEISAPNSKTQFWWKGNITPPENFGKWAALIDHFVRHCQGRYGAEEVRQWFFEVWNEPNLYGAFWDGTRSQYFEMYRITAQTIKAIDRALRVGGPATSNFVPDNRFEAETEDVSKQATFRMKDLSEGQWRGVWIETFLAFCAANQLPVDFIACHPYPTDFPLDTGGIFHPRTRPATSTRDDLQWLRKTVAASAYPNAEIHLTEWSSSPSPRDHSHDSLPAATFVVRANIESTGLADSLAYWVFSDVFEESAAGDTIFHGGFGMINFQGIVKPTFHAYRFLNQLGKEEITRSPGIIATRDKDGLIQVLAYHYPEELREAPPMTNSSAAAEEILALGKPRQLEVEIRDLKPGTRLAVETLDVNHGFCLKAWKDLGSPEPPTREQAKALRTASWELHREEISADRSGSLHFRLTLEPWAVVMIREAAAPGVAPPL